MQDDGEGLAPAAPVAAAPAITTAAAAAEFIAGAGFVDLQRAAIDFFAIEFGDGRLGFFVIGEFDKAESLGAAGFAVRDDRHEAISP